MPNAYPSNALILTSLKWVGQKQMYLQKLIVNGITQVIASCSGLFVHLMHKNKLSTLSPLLIMNTGHETIVVSFMVSTHNQSTINSGVSQPWALIRDC